MKGGCHRIYTNKTFLYPFFPKMITPGYYEAECSEKKKCKEGKYCNLLYCEDCHKEKIACTNKVQCCKGMECVYGRCEKKSKGDPGEKKDFLAFRIQVVFESIMYSNVNLM